MNFEDKSILITGSSRGIGQAAAKAFLGRGAGVVIHGRTLGSLETAIQKLGRSNRICTVEGDVQTEQSCKAIVDKAASRLGSLDILINSAGISLIASVEETTEDIWDRTMDINLKGTFFASNMP